jgi:hypothetical protein
VKQIALPLVERHFDRLFVQNQVIERAIPALRLHQVYPHSTLLFPTRHIAAAVAVADVVG